MILWISQIFEYLISPNSPARNVQGCFLYYFVRCRILYRGLRGVEDVAPYGFVRFAFSKGEKGDRAAVDEDAAVLLVTDCGRPMVAPTGLCGCPL